jgi:hypothetical protein
VLLCSSNPAQRRLKHSRKAVEQQYRRAMAIEIVSLLLFSLFLAVFIVFTVPLTGALVRLRANYNPKGLQLDPEDGVQPHTGPVITSFFVMLSRVRQLEVSDVPYELFIGRAHGNIDSELEWSYEGHKYARLSCLSSYLTLPFLLL